MTVYVDNPMPESTRENWCHLLADSMMELHTFAASIGLNPSWFQNNPRWPHYDLSLNKRALAVRRGAKETTAQEYMRRGMMGEPKLLTQRDRKALYRAGWDLLDGAGLQLVLERYEATVADLERQLEQAVESHTAQGYEAYKARRWAAAWKAAAKRMRRLCQGLTIQRDTILEKLNRAASQGVLSEGRIMQLEAALGNILLDIDKAKGEGGQYMPLEDEG